MAPHGYPPLAGSRTPSPRVPSRCQGWVAPEAPRGSAQPRLQLVQPSPFVSSRISKWCAAPAGPLRVYCRTSAGRCSQAPPPPASLGSTVLLCCCRPGLMASSPPARACCRSVNHLAATCASFSHLCAAAVAAQRLLPWTEYVLAAE
eukprot:scaffold77063_cov63-Phaeocystis_antarctica.AAC.2